ncbi:MAG: Predicted dinucleotide-binding enzymes [uncultured Quadrisphaera sp.]|uniref:Predicted dinucleotide-binding enzymes n=1 Tax=uncultured Quadrisphaera sp. TaxID=904978 RepID=A0A6J4Q176_9ACTN|nr:MAG: Predicted dinucleotide-binding enzymes [uncultured Quadrisphaera sp.]
MGFIGSGKIGSAAARLAVGAGHDVVMSNSRGPETLTDLVGELGPRARAGTSLDAAQSGDVVVVTIPLKEYDQVPRDALAGKVVLDTMNYYPERDGQIAALDDESTTTSELLQAHLPDSRVVKVFNNIHFAHLAELPRPAGADDRSAIAIAGDDAAAKATVTGLLDDMGYDAHDLGPLSEGWRTQRDTSAYGQFYFNDPQDLAAGPRQATAATIAQKASEAKRYRDS